MNETTSKFQHSVTLCRNFHINLTRLVFCCAFCTIACWSRPDAFVPSVYSKSRAVRCVRAVLPDVLCDCFCQSSDKQTRSDEVPFQLFPTALHMLASTLRISCYGRYDFSPEDGFHFFIRHLQTEPAALRISIGPCCSQITRGQQISIQAILD